MVQRLQAEARRIAWFWRDATATNADGVVRADGNVHADGDMNADGDIRLRRTRYRHANRPHGAGLALASRVRYAPASHHVFA